MHLSSYEGVNVLVSAWLDNNRPHPTTEIEIVENKKTSQDLKNEKPILHQLEPTDLVKNSNPARFDSEKTQRVKLETKAREFGLTKNQASAKNSLQKPNPNTTVDADTEAIPEFARHAATNRSQASVSKISQDLPSDIQQSDTTNLNTDANIYYSFYNRVEELYRVRWEERLNYYWNRLSLDFKRNNLSGRAWTTTFEIILAGNGEYQSGTILQSCGYPPFDEAAIFAFRNARYFPNVPRAKVEPDGLVRLKYRFRVNVGQ